MDLTLLRENGGTTDEVRGSCHLGAAHNLAICHVEIESLVRQADLLSALDCRMSIVLLIRRLDSSEYQNLLPCYLIAARVQKPDPVVFGYVVDSLPLIFLNLINFHLIYEFEWLTLRDVVYRGAVLKLLPSECEYVLVIE